MYQGLPGGTLFQRCQDSLSATHSRLCEDKRWEDAPGYTHGPSSRSWRTTEIERGKEAGGHAHALLLALICIIVALIMPQMVLTETIKTILGLLLIVGTVLASVAHWFYFEPILGLGSALFLIGLLMSVIGFTRGL